MAVCRNFAAHVRRHLRYSVLRNPAVVNSAMSSEVTMQMLEVLRRDLQSIGRSRASEEADPAVRDGKGRQSEMVTSHLQEVADLVRFREDLMKCSEDCEKNLDNKIRLTVEILTSASEPPAVCDYGRLESIRAQIMQNGDEECSEASSSYKSAEQCEDEQSSELDSDLRIDSDKIAEGERSIAQENPFIQRLAHFLFSDLKKLPLEIQMNEENDELWTELSPEEQRNWCDIAIAAKNSFNSSFMTPYSGGVDTNLPIPRCEEESINWNEDKKRNSGRRSRGRRKRSGSFPHVPR